MTPSESPVFLIRFARSFRIAFKRLSKKYPSLNADVAGLLDQLRIAPQKSVTTSVEMQAARFSLLGLNPSQNFRLAIKWRGNIHQTTNILCTSFPFP